MNTIINPMEQVDLAFYYIIGFSFLLLFGITITMIYFVIRYHHSRNPIPSDIRGSWKLELVWTIVPTIIAISMFLIGWSAYSGLRTAPKDSIQIEVLAQKYSWLFIYPNDKEVENELVVPLGQPIKLTITSEDVLHSFFLPAFRVKVDAVQGLNTHAWFITDQLGEYDIHCTEYCGVGHADMNAKLKVISEEDYLVWLEQEDDEGDDYDDDEGDGDDEGSENEEEE